ncbi:chloroplast import component protein [bacterium BMS3Abin01]|nr:chloroplast import component protein [bacterium BMS3Abin01]
MNDERSTPKSGSGLDSNVAGLLCYVLGWLTGLIFILIEKDDRFVRFHAAQSIVVFGGLTVVEFILWAFVFAVPSLWFFFPLLGLAWLVLWILLMVKAFQGEEFHLPIAGDIADNWV